MVSMETNGQTPAVVTPQSTEITPWSAETAVDIFNQNSGEDSYTSWMNIDTGENLVHLIGAGFSVWSIYANVARLVDGEVKQGVVSFVTERENKLILDNLATMDKQIQKTAGRAKEDIRTNLGRSCKYHYAGFRVQDPTPVVRIARLGKLLHDSLNKLSHEKFLEGPNVGKLKWGTNFMRNTVIIKRVDATKLQEFGTSYEARVDYFPLSGFFDASLSDAPKIAKALGQYLNPQTQLPFQIRDFFTPEEWEALDAWVAVTKGDVRYGLKPANDDLIRSTFERQPFLLGAQKKNGQFLYPHDRNGNPIKEFVDELQRLGIRYVRNLDEAARVLQNNGTELSPMGQAIVEDDPVQVLGQTPQQQYVAPQTYVSAPSSKPPAQSYAPARQPQGPPVVTQPQGGGFVPNPSTVVTPSLDENSDDGPDFTSTIW